MRQAPNPDRAWRLELPSELIVACVIEAEMSGGDNLRREPIELPVMYRAKGSEQQLACPSQLEAGNIRCGQERPAERSV